MSFKYLINHLIATFRRPHKEFLSVSNYIRDIIEEHYEQSILGDINGDAIVNIQDIILLVNIIINGQSNETGDVNSDGLVNILDVVRILNFILS